MWFRESNSYFCKIENFAYGEISERSFSNPHPWTIFKKYHSDKSHNVTSIGLSSLHLHIIWIIEHCCVEGKACSENTRLELCCHHSGWDIILQADAVRMGKCCDPLESEMGTSMYYSRFCLISFDTTMCNIYDGEPSTWVKLTKLHKQSRQSLGQQICRKALFTSIQSVRPRSDIWMAWVHW